MTVSETAPPPASGLGSNSNYILSSDCNPILDLFVTINVTQDIVCESSSPAVDGYSAPGFGFQLNAFSPDGETAAWQQYVIALFGSELTGDAKVHPISWVEGTKMAKEFEQRIQFGASEKLDVVRVSDVGVRNACQLVFRPPGADDLDAFPVGKTPRVIARGSTAPVGLTVICSCNIGWQGTTTQTRQLLLKVVHCLPLLDAQILRVDDPRRVAVEATRGGEQRGVRLQSEWRRNPWIRPRLPGRDQRDAHPKRLSKLGLRDPPV